MREEERRRRGEEERRGRGEGGERNNEGGGEKGVAGRSAARYTLATTRFHLAKSGIGLGMRLVLTLVNPLN